MIRWLLLAGMGLALAGPSAYAQGTSKADPPADPPSAEKKSDENPFAALEKERNELRANMVKKYREAKDEEQAQIYKDWQKADQAINAKMTAVAFEHPEVRQAYIILIMALHQGGEKATQASEALRKYHLVKPYAHDKNAFMILLSTKYGIELVEMAEAKNPDPVCKAAAAYSLGLNAIQNRRKNPGGEKATIKAAEDAFARIAKYDDGKSKEIRAYGIQAKGKLAGLLNLDRIQIGKPVPDIDGIDLDGKAFKLSDYKGKVILLDYWAFW
ncbi:MAG: hypothetical protein U0798_04640 [Gemmataceae bacterium]